MRVLLEVVSGAEPGRWVALEEGDALRVGSAEPAEMAVTGDPRLAPQHFSISCLQAGCRIQNLDMTRSVFVNGEPALAADLTSGDQIYAGATLFRVILVPPTLEDYLARLVGLAEQERSLRLLTLLATQPAGVYALLDAARNPRVLESLRSSGERYECLYEGAAAADLADCAPFLAAIPPRSRLLRSLVMEGWGEAWGLFATSAAGFDEVRRQFRRFLLVETEDGRELYFRFYDPRVLRGFLPTCTREQLVSIFGPISSFFVEDEDPDRVLRFTCHGDGGRCNILPLTVSRTGAG